MPPITGTLHVPTSSGGFVVQAFVEAVKQVPALVVLAWLVHTNATTSKSYLDSLATRDAQHAVALTGVRDAVRELAVAIADLRGRVAGSGGAQ